MGNKSTKCSHNWNPDETNGTEWCNRCGETKSTESGLDKVKEESMEGQKEVIVEVMGKYRGDICDIISEMLDNPNECGIYPTSVAYKKFDDLILRVIKSAIIRVKNLPVYLVDDRMGPDELEQYSHAVSKRDVVTILEKLGGLDAPNSYWGKK